MRGALLTMSGSKLRKGFNSLAANAQRKPSPMLRGAAYFVNRKLAAAWMSWRAYSDEVMRLRRAASGLVHGPKRKAWNRWETFASEERVANSCHRPPPLPHGHQPTRCRLACRTGRRVAAAAEARSRRDARQRRHESVEPLARRTRGDAQASLRRLWHAPGAATVHAKPGSASPPPFRNRRRLSARAHPKHSIYFLVAQSFSL